MDNPDPTTPPRNPRFSAEAVVGTGITIASLGVLLLLLGLAQTMREVHAAASILLPIGAVMLIAGGIAAATARGQKGR